MKKVVRLTESDLSRIVKRIIKEEMMDNDIKDGGTYTVLMPTDSTGKNRMPVQVKVLGRDRNDPNDIVVTPLQDVDYKNKESGMMNRFEKGKHYITSAQYFK